MEIAVIFHCTHPLIEIYLFFQVAGFFRVFAAKLLLLPGYFYSCGHSTLSHRCVDLRTGYHFQNTDHSLFQLLCNSYFVSLRWLLDLFQICFVLTNALPDIGKETSRLGLSDTVLHRHCVLYCLFSEHEHLQQPLLWLSHCIGRTRSCFLGTESCKFSLVRYRYLHYGAFPFRPSPSRLTLAELE